MEHRKPLLDLEKLTVEHALFALAFGLALGIRLLLLGSNPLTEYEAAWANQALALSRGEPVTLGPQPLYLIFTTFVFWLVKPGEAWARLLPALCGSLLVLLPMLSRRWSGDSPWRRRAGVVLAFGLALDPALVALSRQAGSSMPALALSLLAVGLVADRRWQLAGITAGLALLSGVQVWQGVILLSLTWGIIRLAEKSGLSHFQSNLLPEINGEDSPTPPVTPTSFRIFLLFAVGTLLLGGTLFMRFPQGLAAFASSLSAYLQNWVPGSDLLPVPALRLPVALLASQPLVVLFAIIAILRVWIKPEDHLLYNLGRKLSIWAALALFFAMIHPNRQVSDIVWALLPLWALAALELAACVPAEKDRRDLPVTFAHAAITTLFGILFFYNLLRLTTLGAQPWLYASVLAGIAFMILVISFIVAAGWSPGVARLGFLWGMTLVLGISMLSTLWYAGFAAPSHPGDLWGRPPAAGQVSELKQTLRDISEWNTGHRTEIDVLVTTSSESLHWQLRDFINVEYRQGISPGIQPSVIITPQEQTSLELAAAYRGQDFTWTKYPGWSGLLPVQWVDWLYFHRAPGTTQQVILWARNDLFPGGVLSTTDSLEAQPAPNNEKEPLP